MHKHHIRPKIDENSGGNPVYFRFWDGNLWLMEVTLGLNRRALTIFQGFVLSAASIRLQEQNPRENS